MNFLQFDLDSDYPAEVEKQVVGRDMLFKVCKIPGLTCIGHPCYEVLRICADPEITSVFLKEVKNTIALMVIHVYIFYMVQILWLVFVKYIYYFGARYSSSIYVLLFLFFFY